MASDEELLHIFTGTMSADRKVREEAEFALSQFSTRDPQFVLRLLHFSCRELPPAARNAQLAAAIRLRNVISRSDWNRQSYFNNDLRTAIRSSIVPLQCAAHVPELIRRQLLSTARELIGYDYPHRWPTLLPQLMELLSEGTRALPIGGSGLEATPVAMAVTLQLKGALGVMHGCCRVYEDAVAVPADAVDAFADTVLPPVLLLAQRLVAAWGAEVSRVQHMAESTRVENLEVSAWHAELSHCLRLVMKSVHSLAALRWPRFLCNESAFDGFVQGCLGELLIMSQTVLLPFFRDRISLANAHDESDLAPLFQTSSVWRLLKWLECMSCKLMHDLVPASDTEKRARSVAKLFCNRHLQSIAQISLNLVRWHAGPRQVTSKAYIMALEILTLGVGVKSVYNSVISPNAEEILTFLLFPRLCFSASEAELWSFNPEEYVRLQTSSVGDLYNPRVVSASLLLSIVVASKPFHDATISGKFIQFLNTQLMTNARAAFELGNMDAAKAVDAAFFTIYQMSLLLATLGFDDNKIEWLLSTYVNPAIKCPIGFLRARGVLVLSVFAKRIQWSSPESYQRLLIDVLPLLQDAEVPVRIQTCTALSRLICHPYARDIITPCIGELMQHYFLAMRLMDNEGVVRTLRKTVVFYRDVLSQWALQLTELLVQHFLQVLQRVVIAEQSADAAVQGKGSFSEEDETAADSLLTADELLQTLITLVRALPPGVEADNRDLIVQMQRHTGGILFAVLSNETGGTLGFMDAALMLLTTLLSRSRGVDPALWRLVPCLYRLASEGAVDYFGMMLAPLDNYVCVAPRQFLLAPLYELCDVPPFAADVAAMTPADIVGNMCGLVLAAADKLRARELSSVPKMYDAILQNTWQICQEDPSLALRSASIVQHITQSILRVLGDPRQQRRPPSLKILFANSLLSAILSHAATAVSTLCAAGALAPLFSQYIELVLHDEGIKASLRSYDRRLFVLSISALVRLLLDGTAPLLIDSVDDVLYCVFHSGALSEFSHREALLAAAELKKRAEHPLCAADGKDEDNDDDEWTDEESDIDMDDDEDDDDDEEYDDLEMDEENVEQDDDAALNNDSRFQTLLAQTAAARRGGKGRGDARRHGVEQEEEEEEEEGEEEEEEEDDNVLDEDDFVSPIDTCNVWHSLITATDMALRAGLSFRFTQFLSGAESPLESIMQTGRLMEQLLAAREGEIAKKNNEVVSS